MEKLENEIKSHFEEEKDLKSKIQSTELKIEEAKSSILNGLEKGGSEILNLDNKKMNLQLLQKAKEDLVSQYNAIFSKRNALKNVCLSNNLLFLYCNMTHAIIIFILCIYSKML